MPCYTVRTISVEFQAKHVSTLELAAKNLGYSWYQNGSLVTLRKDGRVITINLDQQKAKFKEDLQDAVNELKRGYTMESLKKAAYANKWQPQKVGANRVQLIKMYY